jgi:glyoxylase-like metal-dependent hydrolase (beta-lactamase superfamily II)
MASTVRLLVILFAILLSTAAMAVEQQRPGPFNAETLADGVYLIRPAHGRPDLANSLVVERDDGLLVVDAQPTPGAAGLLLAAIARLSPKPVRYLVISHPHSESAGGASAFPDSTLIAASEACRLLIDDAEFDFGAESRLLSGNKGEWQPPERVAPTLVVTATTTLDDPNNPVEMNPLQPAHTAGDMLIVLPKANIVYAGALLPLDRNPYAEDADIGGWLNALNRISRMAPELVVPLRGPAVDPVELRRRRDGFAWLRGQVEECFINQINPHRMPHHILALPDASKHFDLEAEPSFLEGVVMKSAMEGVEHRKKRGVWEEE